MFTGRYTHAIDSKGRLTFPVEYRKLLEEGGFITQGFDQNLMVMSPASFERAAEGIRQRSITDPHARELRRRFFSNAERIQFDKVGRILLPQFLRDFAGLQSNALLIGMDTIIELWSPERYHAREQTMDPELDAQRFADIDLVI